MSYRGELICLFDNITFKNKVWFLDYEIDYHRILNDVENTYIRTKEEEEEVEAEVKEHMNACFYREVWVNENKTDLSEGDTMNVIECLIENREKPEIINDKIWLKLNNLKNAFEYLESYQDTLPLNMSVIMETNKLVSNGLFNGGEFRTIEVGASGTSVIYLQFNKIEKRLKSLIEFVNEKRMEITKLEDFIKLSAIFFGEFLKIHPFKNGNGRTARLLLQYILKKVSYTPFSVYLPSSNFREKYLSVIQNAQQYDSNYCELATYLLMSAYNTSRKIDYLLL